MKVIKIIALLLLFSFKPLVGTAQLELPNFVIILTDDLGYADVGVYGSPRIETPRIDQMAENGVKFKEFYVESLCSPTRAALLTGSYAYRVGASTVFWPDSDDGLNPDEITLADLLQEQGYVTATIGKWHLGHHEEFLPTNQGFDYYFGIPFSNDMGPDARRGPFDPLPILRNEDIIERGPDQRKLTKRYTEETIQFIEENQEEPFFVYLQHTMPHVPLYVSDEFKAKSEFGLYGDVVEEIDWSTGEIIDKLNELGLSDNTLVIWTSDNGPWIQKGKDGGLATPLREGKGTSWEGGHRVPALMTWPGQISEKIVIEEMTTVMDLYPTIAYLAGADLPNGRVIDGKNIWTLITGETTETPHEVYFYYRLRQLQAVRMGEWKLHLEGTRRDYNNVHYDYTDNFNFHLREKLFNLAEDPGEQRNLVLDYPEIVEELKQRVEKHQRDIEENSRPLGVIDQE